jgi:hypothetical protein
VIERFRTGLRDGHKGAAAEVPFDPGARWSATSSPLRPGRRGFAVHATLDGVAFDSAIVARSRRFWLPVPAEVMAAASVGIGATCDITVAPMADAG